MNTKRLLILTGTIILSSALVSTWLLLLSEQIILTRAASYTVCETGLPNCDYSSIQEAVDAASDGDEIKVAEGSYSGINNRFGHAQVVYLDKSITIRGGYTTTNWNTADPLANPTTVDAGGHGRVLYISGNISPTIEGLRITGGEAEGMDSPIGFDIGGGVFIISATATIQDNYIFENAANSSQYGAGGGLYLYQSAAILDGNTIISNTAQHSGGGIQLNSSAAILTNNTISANNVPGFNGDGIFIGNSPATLIGNIISEQLGRGVFVDISPAMFIQNTITGNLHGIFLWESDNASLYGNTISHNSTGGLWSNGDNVTIYGNTFSHNTADWWAGFDVGGQNVRIIGNLVYSNTAVNMGGGGTIADNVQFIGNTVISNTAGEGGGLSLPDPSSANVIDGNIFSGNHALGQGGGLALGGGNPIVTNNIFFDNLADGSGSAIAITGGAPLSRLAHNTFARNYGGDGSGIHVFSGTVVMTNTLIVSHTVGISVQDNATVFLESTLWGNGAWSNVLEWSGGGTINFSNNQWGTANFVDPDAGDYHIGSSSNAIDTGVDAGVTRDIDRQPRPYQEPDIGADEYWPPGLPIYIYLPLTNK
jgi:parallel beta-helix repeat protein